MKIFRTFVLALAFATLLPALSGAQSLPAAPDDLTFVDIGVCLKCDFKDRFEDENGNALMEFDMLRAPIRGSFAFGSDMWLVMAEVEYSGLWRITDQPTSAFSGNRVGRSLRADVAVGRYIIEGFAARAGVSHFYATRTAVVNHNTNAVAEVATTLTAPFVGVAADFSHLSSWIISGHADMMLLSTMRDSYYEGFNSTTMGINGFKAGAKVGYRWGRIGVYYSPGFYSNEAKEGNDGDDKSRRFSFGDHLVGARLGF